MKSKKAQNVTITALCLSAAAMTALLIVAVSIEPAHAGASARGGHYIMFTGAVAGSTDMLYVIDRRSQKMNAYEFAAQVNTLNIAGQVELNKIFRD